MEEKHYEITKENIKNHELIGLNVVVKESSDPKKTGLKGKVMNETQNTFVIVFEEKEIILPKKECVFEFDIGEKVLVDGKKIMKRPQDRIKEWILWQK